MTTEPEEEIEELEGSPETRVGLADGDFVVLDPDYLDPRGEAQGVLALLHSIERGQWVLIGKGEGDGYSQEWVAVGAKADKKPGLSRVK